MMVEWGGGGGNIVSSSATGQGTTQKGETKERKEEEEEEALLDISDRVTAMEEAMAKVIAEDKEWHCFDKEYFKRRMEAEWRERVEEKKAMMGESVEKQTPSFEKEEIKCTNNGALFVSCAEEEKVGAVQEAIYALKKRGGEEMRDAVEASYKEARAGFTEAANSALEEAVSKVRAKSELYRRRDAEEAARVTEDNDCRRRAQ